MKSRSLFIAILVFAGVAIGYIAFYLTQPPSVQLQMKDVSSVGLAVPAALIAFCFQLRLSRHSRLDAWTRDYQSLLRDLAEWLARDYPRVYSDQDYTKTARSYAQAEGLSAVLLSIGLKPFKGKGSVFALCDDLGQLGRYPPGTPRFSGPARVLEDSIHEHLRAAPQYVSSLFK